MGNEASGYSLRCCSDADGALAPAVLTKTTVQDGGGQYTARPPVRGNSADEPGHLLQEVTAHDTVASATGRKPCQRWGQWGDDSSDDDEADGFGTLRGIAATTSEQTSLVNVTLSSCDTLQQPHPQVRPKRLVPPPRRTAEQKAKNQNEIAQRLQQQQVF
jgi:hypothetical protein